MTVETTPPPLPFFLVFSFMVVQIGGYNLKIWIMSPLRASHFPVIVWQFWGGLITAVGLPQWRGLTQIHPHIDLFTRHYYYTAQLLWPKVKIEFLWQSAPEHFLKWFNLSNCPLELGETGNVFLRSTQKILCFWCFYLKCFTNVCLKVFSTLRYKVV